jgi:hypothetical protein
MNAGQNAIPPFWPERQYRHDKNCKNYATAICITPNCAASFATNQLATNPTAIRNPLKIKLSMAPIPNYRRRMPQAGRGLKGVSRVEI